MIESIKGPFDKLDDALKKNKPVFTKTSYGDEGSNTFSVRELNSNLETYQTLWKDVALMWMPLVAAGWTYYFKTKSDQAIAERIKNQ